MTDSGSTPPVSVRTSAVLARLLLGHSRASLYMTRTTGDCTLDVFSRHLLHASLTHLSLVIPIAAATLQHGGAI